MEDFVVLLSLINSNQTHTLPKSLGASNLQ